MKRPFNKSKLDEAINASRLTLEAQANELLSSSGIAVPTRKDEERLAKRRAGIIGRNVRDERILTLHGSDSFIEISRRPIANDTSAITRGFAVPFSPPPDLALSLKEQAREIDDALAFLFDIFDGDKIIKTILIAIVKYDEMKYNSNKSVSNITGLSIEAIVSAKARIRYKLDKNGIVSLISLISAAKGNKK